MIYFLVVFLSPWVSAVLIIGAAVSVSGGGHDGGGEQTET